MDNSPSVRVGAGRGRGRDLAHQRHQQRGEDEGQHDDAEGIGEGERRRLPIGKVPELAQRGGIARAGQAGQRAVACGEAGQ